MRAAGEKADQGRAAGDESGEIEERELRSRPGGHAGREPPGGRTMRKPPSAGAPPVPGALQASMRTNCQHP